MSQTRADLKALLSHCDAISLSHSNELYPQCSGNGLPLLRIDTPLCQATIAIQGAQLLAFTPNNGKPLLWLSPQCHFQTGKSLRGGVPICLPWFGAHPTDASKPSHGFARTTDWFLESVDLDDERCELVFRLTHTADALFPYAFTSRLTMRLSQEAELILEMHNTGDSPFDTSWALHSYFKVDDLSTASVSGLENLTYADKVQGFESFTQQEQVTFTGEVDRVFEDVSGFVGITGSPAINITHYNCPSVVVWNPGAALAATMSDVGTNNERGYICVERGAIRGDAWSLDVNEHRSAWIRITQA